ncbi:MAG: hypothetical protein ACPG4N_04830, partial [Gammaproteobacteria bacterium]
MEPTPYTPKKITPLRLIAMAMRGIAGLFSQWPLFVLVATLASPITPHVLITYEAHGHNGHNGHAIKTSCRYLGSRGFIET